MFTTTVLRKTCAVYKIAIMSRAIQQDGLPEEMVNRTYEVTANDVFSDKLGIYYWVTHGGEKWVVSKENTTKVH